MNAALRLGALEAPVPPRSVSIRVVNPIAGSRVSLLHLLAGEKLRLIAAFPAQVQLSAACFASFADCDERVGFHPGILTRLARRSGELTLLNLLTEQGEPDNNWRLPMMLRDLLWWDGSVPASSQLAHALLPAGALARLVGGQDMQFESDDFNRAYRITAGDLRTATDVEAVRAGLADGTIDIVGTDHAPHPREDKDCEWSAAAFGMTGLETALSVVQETMVDTGRMTWADVARVLSSTPAAIGRVADQGRPIAVGEPANLTLVDPAARWVVVPHDQATASDNSPFAGREMHGRVVATFLRGRATVLDGLPQDDADGSHRAAGRTEAR